MKKLILLSAMLVTLLSCKKDNNTQITLIGKWHLVADTVQTFSGGALIKTEININTNIGLSDFELYQGGNLDIYNRESYSAQPTYTTGGNGITFNLPISDGGTPASAKTASVKMQTAGRLLLYYPPVSTFGTSTTMEFVKLSTRE